MRTDLVLPDPSQGTLSFVMTDVVGSTARWEREPDRMHELLTKYDEVVEEVVHLLGGSVVHDRGEGDSHFLVFTEVSNAIAASAQLQLHLNQNPDLESLQVRMSVHSGEVIFRDHDYYGPVVNRCARIREIAHGGQVLVSEATLALLQGPCGMEFLPLGTHRLRDLSQPERLYQVCCQGLHSSFPPLRSLSQRSHNLPQQLTSFVGRAEEIRDVMRLLSEQRMVTLTGAGGCGKTRLALHAAAALSEEFQDGVWFVDLTEIPQGGAVADYVAASLDLSADDAQAKVIAQVADQSMLFVLDNCEHVCGQAAVFAHQLLSQCSNAQVLATSRELLAIPGEQLYHVPGLRLPIGSDPIDALRYDAVQLFYERAASRGVNLDREPPTLFNVATLCQRLDGLPLAIELVASTTHLLSLTQLEEQLSDRLAKIRSQAPRPSRQQTMAATIQWSVDLLDEAVVELLRRLCVFASSWTLESATEVCGYGKVSQGHVLDLLGELVAHSLVMSDRSSSDSVRFRLLQTTKEVVSASVRDWATLRKRFFKHFVSLAVHAESLLGTPNEEAGYRHFEEDYDNLERALSLGYQQGWEHWTDLAYAMRRYWEKSGRLSDGRTWMERIADQTDLPLIQRGRALNALGAFCLRQGADLAAQSALEQAAECLAPSANAEYAKVLLNLGIICARLRQVPEAEETFLASERVFATEQEHGYRAIALINLGVLRMDTGQVNEETAAWFAEAERCARNAGVRSTEAIAAANQAAVHLVQGQRPIALAALERAFKIWENLADLAEAACAFVDLASALGPSESSARCLAASVKLNHDGGTELEPRQQKQFTETRSKLSQTLWRPAERFVRSKSYAELVSFALDAIRRAKV